MKEKAVIFREVFGKVLNRKFPPYASLMLLGMYFRVCVVILAVLANFFRAIYFEFSANMSARDEELHEVISQYAMHLIGVY